MASLNLSTNGPSISKSYQSVVNALPPAGPAANSPTYGHWAIFSVTTPLVTAFQQDGGSKEAVLKVQSTGEGELVDLIDEFSDGRVQFAFVKVKDPNSGLPKHAYICWCGEGVPERTKGYFTNYQTAAAKVLHGYHVQITARSERDLTPDGIVQKIADASGSKYSSSRQIAEVEGPGVPSSVSSKPAFMPTSSAIGGTGFNPLSGLKRTEANRHEQVDEDGWGADAPPVTRTQLEKVAPAYQPTKVNLRDISAQQTSTTNSFPRDPVADRPEVVKGTYQPIGKVDIAALRREAQESGPLQDDRPTMIKGTYEPVGKVDIAAIRARAQQPEREISLAPSPGNEEAPKSLAERSTAFSQPERLTTLPKPKVSNRFSSSSSSFSGTKAPIPGAFGLESQTSPKTAQAGASRTFADQGGKTPAQLWAEKKGKQNAGALPPSTKPTFGALKSPTATQPPSGGEWRSGYTGKTWAPVQISNAGQSGDAADNQALGPEDDDTAQGNPSLGGIGGLRDKFNNVPIIGASAMNQDRSATSPPPLDTSNKPNAGREVPIPGLSQEPIGSHEQGRSADIQPPPQPRSPTPPTPVEPESPIRVAVPVSRNMPAVEDAHAEQDAPPQPMPIASLAKEASYHDQLDEPVQEDAARTMASTVAASQFGQSAVAAASTAAHGGRTAIAQYDYEKAEDNELELREGERIINIEMVDDDWWMGENSRGATGLFPSNYVELAADGDSAVLEHPEAHAPAAESAPLSGPPDGIKGATATALYDYEAGEDNELTFPEGAKIANVEFPDEDWWSGEYGGRAGLFPANYVQLDE